MRIAFIVVSFPALSETFVLNQITGLIDFGHAVEIFAGSCPKDSCAKAQSTQPEGRETIRLRARATAGQADSPDNTDRIQAWDDHSPSVKSVPSVVRSPQADKSLADRGTAAVRHPDVDRYNLIAHTHCHNCKPANRPLRFVKALWLALKYGHRNPVAVFRSLNASKYGREASSLNLFYKVILFLSVGEFDVIYCQFGSSGNLGAVLKELGIGGKLVTMFHGSDIRRGIEEGAGIYRKLIDHGDCFLSISSYNYRHLVGFGMDARKIVSHPVGIDLDRYPFRQSGPGPIAERKKGETIRLRADATAGQADYTDVSRRSCRTKPDVSRRSCRTKPDSTDSEPGKQIRIVTVARLAEEKGIAYGIRAIGQLMKEKTLNIQHSTSNIQRGVRYQIVGDGPLRAELETLVGELGLHDIVEFCGAQDSESVAEYLQNADLFLLPSLAEATPVSLMEAQAVGLPVVATRVGSVDEVVVDGQSGFLVPPGDVEALAERLQYLSEHPESWHGMGRVGREHIERHYDVRKLNEKLAELFGRLIGK